MDRFIRQFMEMLTMVLQHPPNQGQLVVVGGVSLIAGAWVFLKVCDKFDLPNVGLITGFLYSALGGSVMLAGMAAGSIWLGEWRQPLGDLGFYSALAALTAVGFYVPLLNLHIKGKYVGTLAAWSLGVATALAVSALVNTGFDMSKSGQRMINRGAEHNAATQDAIRR